MGKQKVLKTCLVGALVCSLGIGLATTAHAQSVDTEYDLIELNRDKTKISLLIVHLKMVDSIGKQQDKGLLLIIQNVLLQDYGVDYYQPIQIMPVSIKLFRSNQILNM